MSGRHCFGRGSVVSRGKCMWASNWPWTYPRNNGASAIADGDGVCSWGSADPRSTSRAFIASSLSMLWLIRGHEGQLAWILQFALQFLNCPRNFCPRNKTDLETGVWFPLSSDGAAGFRRLCDRWPNLSAHYQEQRHPLRSDLLDYAGRASSWR